ncbi:MAG: CinA family nicotinamide mononucleotide deamidase-related protein, partial [Muribaculaceae bacterium]|nr:CinA family nicotinamide mononucleotide deamidase-related protein [Muribaculaceae bacterium]
LGQGTDTNSGTLSRMLDPLGWHVKRVITVPDEADAIVEALKCGLELTDVVLTTGGLGPTNDDITKRTLANFFGAKLVFDQATYDNVLEIFNRRSLTINQLTLTQANVPDNCEIIQNRVGTAPIMWWDRNGKVVVSMPGVPFETRQMFEAEVLPRLLRRFPSTMHYLHRCLMVAWYTESEVSELLTDFEAKLYPHLHLAYLPKPGLLRLRLDAIGPDYNELTHLLDQAVRDIVATLGEKHVLSLNDATLGEILREKLTGTNLTIGTAESCTGGNIAHTITAVAGSSEYFLGSVVSYANTVKTEVLHVDPLLINTLGAVSEPVAAQMAEGARRVLGVDYAVATSGIAGPGGASPGKPVGTVCFAVASPTGTKTFTKHLPGTRDRVIDRATTEAILSLLQHLPLPN